MDAYNVTWSLTRFHKYGSSGSSISMPSVSSSSASVKKIVSPRLDLEPVQLRTDVEGLPLKLFGKL